MSNSCNHMDCSPPGSFVHRVSQARRLEWVAIFFCRESQPRDGTYTCIASGFFYRRATREVLVDRLRQNISITSESSTGQPTDLREISLSPANPQSCPQSVHNLNPKIGPQALPLPKEDLKLVTTTEVVWPSPAKKETW